MSDAPTQEGNGVGQTKETKHLVFKGNFPSLPTEKMADPNMVIALAFLATLGL